MLLEFEGSILEREQVEVCVVGLRTANFRIVLGARDFRNDIVNKT